MLNEVAFANGLGMLTGLLYLVFILLVVVTPNVFRFLFNAQFLGADVASLFPKKVRFGSVVATLVTLVISAWAFGYAWAWLYNKLAKWF